MLKGNKVVLEEIMPESIEQMRVWRNNPGMRQYFREWKDITPAKQQQWYNERGNNTHPNHVYFQIMVVDGDEKKLIGCCGALNTDWRLRSAELSIFLAPEYHGKGLGKEALLLLIDYVFAEMNMHKFWGEAYDSNEAINLYTKVGFKIDGKIRHSWYHNGKYGDSYMFSMLKEEWERSK